MKNRKLWIFFILVALILLCNHIFGLSAYFTDTEALTVMRQMVEDNIALSVFLYVVFTMAGCVLLALPGITFAIAAGLLFGPVLGTLACSLATTAGACLSFLAGRYFLKDALKPKLEKNMYLRRILFEDAQRSDLFLLAVTRFVPLFPYNLQNFAYGITDIKFLPYALYSALFMLPGTAVYTVGAAGVLDSEKRLPYLLFAGILLVGVLAVSWRLKRRVAEK